MSICKLFAFWGLLLVFSAPLFGQQQGTNAPPGENIILAVEGRVEWQRANTDTWTKAEANQKLQPLDKVRTGLRGRATIRLSNQSIVRLNQLTTVEIQPSEEGKKTLLNMRGGSGFFYNREPAGETTFRTPTASGAIRGTEFHLAVDASGATVLTMIDGEVDLRNELGEIRVVSGEQGIVTAGEAPRKTAVLNAINIIQWTLYYPGIIDLAELQLSADEQAPIADAVNAYRKGALPLAAELFPTNRVELTPAQSVFYASVLLSVGQVEEAQATLRELKVADGSNLQRMANALNQLVAAVKFEEFARKSSPELASEWLAESYYQQSRSQLEAARTAARKAVEKSPEFGLGWARLAEMEFSFGQTEAAQEAVERSLNYSSENAQAIALRGFLFAAKNKRAAALAEFERAIQIDPALGNSWLGRGLVKIRMGKAEDGRKDIQTAAALDPNRAVLRSYLGKAQSNEGNQALARKELDLATKLDPNDPTSFLYSALLRQQQNELNEAVRDLEKSQELNDNRSVFRSRMLLDQDRAVRSANLASIYRDNGMIETSFREASRAVNYDYANYAAHLFLANSYDALRDPRAVNLRYETPWMSELLLANLLAPVGAGTLSQTISQQEYSRFFEGDRFGVISLTEYFSNGDWFQRGSQYGYYQNFGYSADVDYHAINGWRPNNDSESITGTLKIKQQITPKDSIFLQGTYFDFEAGDVAQYYDQSFASTTQRVKERQEPLLFAGYHHEWSPGIHTLFLASRFDDTFMRDDPSSFAYARAPTFGRFRQHPTAIDYRSELSGYGAEAQQIWNVTQHTIIAGARVQDGRTENDVDLAPAPGRPGELFIPRALSQDVSTDLKRYSVYLYEQWQVFEPLLLVGGITYDKLTYPVNIDIAPITEDERTRDQVSPKAGFILRPWKNGFFRGAYTRSLGGAFFDNDLRLEPVQVAGFTQAYRSLIPESVLGIVPGTRFETFGLGFDQQLFRNTYFGLDGEYLRSDGAQTIGTYRFAGLLAPGLPSSFVDHLHYDERTLSTTLHQLLGKEWSVGVRYRLTEADLRHRFSDPALVIPNRPPHEEATLHQANLYAIYNLPCGFFSQFHSIWSQQHNRGYSSSMPGDDFWQFHLFGGYRFLQRRAEIRVGVLNLTDKDYKLNPLTLYSEPPRERTFFSSLKLNF